MINLKNALIPYPKEVRETKEKIKVGRFNDKVKILSDTESGEVFCHGTDTLRKKLLSLGAIECAEVTEEIFCFDIRIDENYKAFHKTSSSEAYAFDINSDGVSLCARSEAGVYYGILTLCELFFIENGEVFMPAVSVVDWPDFADRAQFAEGRYGSDFMTRQQWFDMIDYFSKMKFNCVCIGLYGCWPVQYDNSLQEYLYIPFKKYPQLKTPRSIKYYSVKNHEYVLKHDVLPEMFREDFFGELIRYGKKRNVRVEPMFNSLGHNTVIPREFPRLSAKDENGNDTGFGFCTESDETVAFMCDLYDEIIDRYLKPNNIDSIALGLDEVLNSMGIDKNDMKKEYSYLCKCEKCRRFEEKELMLRYIIKLCKHLKKRNMKNIYIYQDMLLYDYDVINEEMKKRFIDEGIYDVTVIDWWSYDVGDAFFLGRKKDVTNIFRSTIKPMTGYFHWTFPTETNQNIKECVELAKELNFEGVRAYTGFDYCYDKNFLYQADVSWNTDMLSRDDFEERYASRLSKNNLSAAYTALRYMKDIMSDDKKDNLMHSLFDYYAHSYLRKERPYPRSYPSEVYSEMLSDEKKYINYLENVYCKAKTAYDIFKNRCTQSGLCAVWQLTAKQYYVSADEFLTIFRLSKYLSCESCDSASLLSELDRLIKAREDLMYDAETVRISGNAYHYLRGMTIIRQYLTDLRDYAEKAFSEGRKPVLDLENLDYVKSPIYDFLR